ncbi:AraC family transcriptional regulator [Eisenbergiella massiliensis]|uniref:AraC family transcriptional regulator n=1 Tax=Eisenbergiella massiliensis TaxID=1720294 RepID=A0A3E3J2U3_9FIRM|nr:AraC family transcriptional regulator [Eisenbergiella massiliensis]
MCALLSPDKPARISESQQIAENARKYILSHYQEQISLSQIAEEIGVNSCYLSDIFHKYMGEPCSRYLLRIRMEQAARLLKENPEEKIYKIAEHTGFVSYLCRFERTLFIILLKIFIPPLPANLLQPDCCLRQFVILAFCLQELFFIAFPAFGQLFLVFSPQAVYLSFVFLPALDQALFPFLLKFSHFCQGHCLYFFFLKLPAFLFLLPGRLKAVQPPAVLFLSHLPPFFKNKPALPFKNPDLSADFVHTGNYCPRIRCRHMKP